MTVIKEVLLTWEAFGLLDVFLPFVLIYAIVYGVLTRSRVLGENAIRYNSLVAFVVSFLAVATLQIVKVLTSIVQWVALSVIAIVFVMILGKFLGGMENMSKKQWPFYVALIIIAGIAFYSLGFKKFINVNLVDSIVLPIIVLLLVFFAVIFYITRGSSAVVKSGSKKEEVSESSSSSPSEEKKEKSKEESPKASEPKSKYAFKYGKPFSK